MSSAATRRLCREFASMKSGPNPSFIASPVGENLFKWEGEIYGPSSSRFDGMKFYVEIIIPPEYPLKPPNIHITSPCYHPNIANTGAICLDVLHHKWTPSLGVSGALLSVVSLLETPNNDDPLNGEAARLWNDEKRFKEELKREMSKKSTE